MGLASIAAVLEQKGHHVEIIDANALQLSEHEIVEKVKGADKILGINKGLKDYAVEMGGDINKISVIPAGVDLERFNSQVDGSAIKGKVWDKKG